MAAGTEIPVSEMTFEETTEAFNATCEKIDDLRLLEISTANLYSDLEKIIKLIINQASIVDDLNAKEIQLSKK